MHPGKEQEGLGAMNIPLASHPKHTFAPYYALLKTNEGISFRVPFIIEKNGVLCQMTSNDLSPGCSVDEILRLVQAIWFTDKRWQRGFPGGWEHLAEPRLFLQAEVKLWTVFIPGRKSIQEKKISLVLYSCLSTKHGVTEDMPFPRGWGKSVFLPLVGMAWATLWATFTVPAAGHQPTVLL